VGGEGLGHVLERLAGGFDADEPLGDPGRDHQHGPEQVPERERDDVGGHDVVLHPEEGAQHQRLGEEDGVVEEGLADEQGQAEHGPLWGSA
jgi:hypothetical protein